MSGQPRDQNQAARAAADPTPDPLMCVRCQVGKNVIIVTADECNAQGGTIISDPFPCPDAGPAESP